MGSTHIKESENIFSDILSPLSQRGDSSQAYFYRIIGCNDENEYLAEIIKFAEKLEMLGNYLLFEERIPISNDNVFIEQLRKLSEQVVLKDFGNGAIVNLLEIHGYFTLTSDPQFNLKVKDAFAKMLKLYLTNDRPVNVSIITNFITKELLWLKEYSKRISFNTLYRPKILYWGSPKSHEIYFLILMSLIEWDILVLNTSFNDRFAKIDPSNEFCYLIRNKIERPIGKFPKRSVIKVPEKSLSDAPELKKDQDPKKKHDLVLADEPIIVVKLKKSETVFEEIMVPLNKRNGFIGKPFPIISTFFARYIGVPSSSDDWKTEYYNSLYNLDKTLQTSGNYLKFLEGIPLPSVSESAQVHQKMIDYTFKDPIQILEHILEANILPKMNDDLIDNTLKKALIDNVNLFVENSGPINPSIVLNFSLKLVAWLLRYLPKLFEFDLENSNPKVLFHGPIKPHEIYLLNAFHQLGCDVLFIHSDEEGDRPFQIFDKDMTHTHLIKNNRYLPIGPFPKGEQSIRKSTIAYNASREIEEVIYSEEVGLFKPWQFESYSTQPITLKTTFDEFKILWFEPSKLRPEFKVQNKRVYVPNLFAKVSGVSEDLHDYWRDLKLLSSTLNTKLIEFVPFAQIRYTKQELYQSNYLLNEQGLLDDERVRKSRHYKFGYLRADLQSFLIAKINELLCSSMFVNKVDEKFKLKILMTILTMDDALLKLIEVFDFAQEIPKVVVYDSRKETLSEEDAIILAYFNRIGMDIVIFTPTNYLTIEQHIRPNMFDVHQLPFVKYDLDLPLLDIISEASTHKQGILARLFNLRKDI
jgi:hypothetical protein